MTKRVFNFGPGPSMLPTEVWDEAQSNLLSYGESGIGIAELSHRSKEFEAIHYGAEESLRRLLGLGDDWAVLFLQGGASMQFAQVPMNLGTNGDYVVTGTWAKKALADAQKLGTPHVAATSAETNFDHIPAELDLRSDASYLHITSNNTIFGTQWHAWPDAPGPVVCDMSSDILSRSIPVDRFGLIYAGAQKNLGPSGVTVVLVKTDLLERAPDNLPAMLDYRTHLTKRSLYNTPPTFPIYILSLVLKWVEAHGGLVAMAERNAAKAARLYEVIDGYDLYEGHAQVGSRSQMNVAFRFTDTEVEASFLEEAAARGMVGLKGHRSVGGMRASIYNAMPLEGVEALASFMEQFANQGATA